MVCRKGLNVHYAGHPLETSNKNYDRKKFCFRYNIPKENKIIILMPGSRQLKSKGIGKFLNKQ